MDNCLADFLPIYVSKSEKLLLIIQNGSISNYRCHAIKYSSPKKLVLKSFLDTILQPRSVCRACWRQETKPWPSFYTLYTNCLSLKNERRKEWKKNDSWNNACLSGQIVKLFYCNKFPRIRKNFDATIQSQMMIFPHTLWLELHSFVQKPCCIF